MISSRRYTGAGRDLPCIESIDYAIPSHPLGNHQNWSANLLKEVKKDSKVILPNGVSNLMNHGWELQTRWSAKNKMNTERQEWEIAQVNDEKNTTEMRLNSGSSALASAHRSSRVCLPFREMSFNALERPGDLNEAAGLGRKQEDTTPH